MSWRFNAKYTCLECLRDVCIKELTNASAEDEVLRLMFLFSDHGYGGTVIESASQSQDLLLNLGINIHFNCKIITIFMCTCIFPS